MAARTFDDAALHAGRNDDTSPLAVLRRRKKTHTPRPSGGDPIPSAHLEQRRWLRHDFTATELRFLSWLAMMAQVESNEVGLWVYDRVDFFSLEQIAERVDLPARIDDKGRFRCPQLVRLIKAMRDAGLIVRVPQRAGSKKREGYRSEASILKVTNLFWEVAGVAAERDAFLTPSPEDADPTSASTAGHNAPVAFEYAKYRNSLARQAAPGQSTYGSIRPPPDRFGRTTRRKRRKRPSPPS
jgi:hypothetical protein